MNNKKKILYLIDHFHVAGGTETHLTILAKNLNKKKYNCIIVAFDFCDNPLSINLRKLNIPIIHLPVGRYYTFNALFKAIELMRIIKREKIDIVQTFHIKSDSYGALIAKISGVKHIVSSKRDTGELKSKWHLILNKLSRGLFQQVISVSESVGSKVSEAELIPIEKINIIYNGVDIEKFAPPDDNQRKIIRDKFGYSHTDFIVGTVAWFRPEKSYDVFFTAVKKIQNSLQNVKVIAVGGGPLLDYYKRYIESVGLSSIVVFTGPTDNVKEYYQLFDIACLVPTINEGLSNSVIEKMSMSLPLIVTNVGGNSELVVNDYNGFVIQPGDSNALSELIIELYNSPFKRYEMGMNSRKIVEKKFTIKKMIENHEAFYDRLFD